jgi:hypothetical protein
MATAAEPSLGLPTHPDSQPLKRLNSVEHGSDCLTCGEPARADYRRDQHTDSRNFNDTITTSTSVGVSHSRAGLGPLISIAQDRVYP